MAIAYLSWKPLERSSPTTQKKVSQPGVGSFLMQSMAPRGRGVIITPCNLTPFKMYTNMLHICLQTNISYVFFKHLACCSSLPPFPSLCGPQLIPPPVFNFSFHSIHILLLLSLGLLRPTSALLLFDPPGFCGYTLTSKILELRSTNKREGVAYVLLGLGYLPKCSIFQFHQIS